MPMLLIAIMAVIFAAFGILAGVNYVDPDLKSRIQTSRALSAQYASLYSAVSLYRSENAGLSPSSLDDVDGYLRPETRAGFGKLSADFTWTVIKTSPSRATLCLTYRGGAQTDAGVVSGLERFYGEASRQRQGITLGTDCLSPDMTPGKDFVKRTLETTAPVAVRIPEVY